MTDEEFPGFGRLPRSAYLAVRNENPKPYKWKAAGTKTLALEKASAVI